MKINQPTLSAALSKCATIASKRNQSPILNTVRLEAKAGCLTLMASDLEHYSVQHIECWGEDADTLGELESVCVGVGRLQTVIGGLDEVTIEREGSRIVVADASSRSELAFLDPDEFAVAMKPAEDRYDDIGVNCADLAEALKKVAWAAAGKEIGRDLIENIHVSLGPREMICEAFDGKKFARIAKPAICASADFLIHQSKASALIEALNCADAKIGFSNKHIRVTHKFGADYFKLGEGAYLNTQLLLVELKDAKLVGKVPTEWLKQQCSKCISLQNQLTSDLFGAAIVETSENSMSVSFADTEAAHGVNHAGEFKPSRNKIGLKYLLEGLRAFGGCNPSLFTIPSRIVMRHSGLDVMISTMRENV